MSAKKNKNNWFELYDAFDKENSNLPKLIFDKKTKYLKISDYADKKENLIEKLLKKNKNKKD